MSLVSAFDFDLPDRLIAQEPRPRGTSRLLVVRRETQTWEEREIADLPRVLDAGDRLVANDTRVFPARLAGRRGTGGGTAECFLLERRADDEWLALVKPGRKLAPGAVLVFDDAARAPGVSIHAVVTERQPFGRRLVRFEVAGAATFDEAVDRIGHVPLPPYIKRDDTAGDRERYQTVYASTRGSVAAPTAGLHFDPGLLAALSGAGIGWTTITHHVGYGTFKPVRVETVEAHAVDPEHYTIPVEAARAIAATRHAGHRIVAVGTTTTRALESSAADGGVRAGQGTTDLFIHPGYRFRVVDALVTNFHLPKSSLLMLVAAFAGLELTLAAYRHAVAREFRFYSYGDAMVVI